MHDVQSKVIFKINLSFTRENSPCVCVENRIRISDVFPFTIEKIYLGKGKQRGKMVKRKKNGVNRFLPKTSLLYYRNSFPSILTYRCHTTLHLSSEELHSQATDDWFNCGSTTELTGSLKALSQDLKNWR